MKIDVFIQAAMIVQVPKTTPSLAIDLYRLKRTHEAK